jgi:hypothetical protein
MSSEASQKFWPVHRPMFGWLVGWLAGWLVVFLGVYPETWVPSDDFATGCDPDVCHEFRDPKVRFGTYGSCSLHT